MDITTIVASIGGLVATTNIVVEVLKKITSNVIPTNALAVLVSEFVTLLYGSLYINSTGEETTYISILSLLIVGLFVSYAAMFGFDKLREVLSWYNTDTIDKGA